MLVILDGRKGENMRSMLLKVGLYLLHQEWFRFQLVKLTTSVMENSVEGELADFIKRHKRSIVTIVNKEVVLAESVIDERIQAALKEYK